MLPSLFDLTPCLFLAISLTAPVTWAGPAGPLREQLSGQFELVDPAGAAAVVTAAIDQAVSELGFLTRPLVRSRLQKDHGPRRVLRLELEADHIGWGFLGQPWVQTRAGLTEAREVDENGSAQITQQLEGEALVQIAKRPEGTRRLEVRASADGVSVHFHLESPRLPHGLDYELSYRRVQSPRLQAAP